MIKKTLLLAVLLSVILLIAATAVFADSTMVGTLSAVLDNKNGTVTAMFVGYCGGEPVMIGPSTWSADAKDLSNVTAQDIGNKLCGSDHIVKRITKSTNTGKEIVAEAIIVSPSAPILVGR